MSPPPDRLLHRDRLLDLLDRFHDRRVVLVHGKAGQGKSTLVSDFLRRCGQPHAWCGLREPDRDPGRLLSSLYNALSGLSGLSRLSALPASPRHKPPAASPTPQDLAALAEGIPTEDAYLVLDDFRHLREQRESIELLNTLLFELPPRLHWVLVSRSYPALALARLRSRRQLVEISDVELAFRREETEALLCGLWSFPLTAEQIDRLTDVSRGWVTALVHLAAALETKDPPAREIEVQRFLEEGRLPTLDEYFEREVLQELRPDEAESLAVLAPFASLSRELAMELLGQRASELLETRRSDSYFLQWRDASLGVFGFHGLFAGYLRSRFAALPDARRRQVHATAAQYFQRRGQLEEALHHRLESGELEQAVDLLQGPADEMLERSQYDRLQEMLDRFPAPFRQTHPLLSYYQAITTNLLEPQPSRKTLQGLLEDFEGQEDFARAARIYAVLLTNYLFYQGNRDAVEELTRLGESFLQQRGHLLASDRREVLEALLALARWWTRPDLDEAFEIALQAEETSFHTGNAELLILSHLVLARIYLDRGQFEQSRRILGETQELLTRNPGCGLYEALLRFYLGDTYFYLGDLPRALEQVTEGRRRSFPGFLFDAYLRLNQALYLLYMPGEADVAAAAEILDTAREARLAENLYVRYYSVYLLRMLLAYRRGNREQARYYCRRLQAPENRELLRSDYPYGYLALAEILVFFGEHEAALRALEELPRESSEDEDKHPYPCATAWALEGLIRAREGDAGAAGRCFGRMLHLLELHGYRNLDICSPELLQQVAEACGRSTRGRPILEPSAGGPAALSDLSVAVTGCFREFRRLRAPPVDAAAAAAKTPPLTLLTLGEFRVFVGDQELAATTLIRQKRVMDLLKLLVVHRKTGMVKEVLYDLFWPGYLPKSSRDNLNSIIYRLRRTLGEERPYILTEGATLNLNPALCRVDADQFLETLARAERAFQHGRLPEPAGAIRKVGRAAPSTAEARAEAQAEAQAKAKELYYRAKSLYGGEFLENDLYYDDIRDARESLLSLYLQLLFRLTLLSLDAGENYQALVLAKELVHKDPLCEPAYRLLMIASSLVGNRSDVPRVAERLTDRLKRAYGIQSDPRTASLQKLLLEGAPIDRELWSDEAMI